MKYPQPNICPVPGTRKYLLLDDYKITVGGVDTCVPALFEFDGASIPWYGWHATYTPFHPIVILPSLIHDWHFYNHQVNLQTANDIFYNLLLQNEANESFNPSSDGGSSLSPLGGDLYSTPRVNVWPAWGPSTTVKVSSPFFSFTIIGHSFVRSCRQ